MIHFTRFAIFALARDSMFVLLAVATLMLAFSFEPVLACKIGATLELIFSLVLLLRGFCLTESRFAHSEVWRVLNSDERPVGKFGQQLPQARFEELLLSFAKAAAGMAVTLYSSALIMAIAGFIDS
jgi:hypothetical protein